MNLLHGCGNTNRGWRTERRAKLENGKYMKQDKEQDEKEDTDGGHSVQLHLEPDQEEKLRRQCSLSGWR